MRARHGYGIATMLGVLAVAVTLGALTDPARSAPASAVPTPAIDSPAIDTPVPRPRSKPVAIAVGNPAGEVRVGEEVGYRIAVTNQGTQPLRLAVEAYPPTGLRDLRPKPADGRVRWWITLDPGTGRELMLIGRYASAGPPSDVVACAYSDLRRAPLACGSHVDVVGTTDVVTALAWLGLGGGAAAFLIGYRQLRRGRRFTEAV